MSGGSMDHLFWRVEQAIFRSDTLERRAFADHLKLVAKALHDIEWVDSGDYGDGDDVEAIRACLTPAQMLSAAIQEANESLANLKAELARAENV